MNNETLEKYLLQNRAQLASISELLNRNMQFAGSNNASYVNSTTAMPIGFNSPNLFSQLTATVGNTFGEGAGSAMGMLQQLSANPQVQQMLPQFIAQPLAMMQTAAPIGGVANAGDFFYANKFRSLGRNIPRTSLPISFENRAAVDLYNEQQKQQQEYGQSIGIDDLNVADPLEALPSDMAANPNLGKTAGFRNVLKMRGQELSFNRAFSLFNEMDIFGSRVDADFEKSAEYAELQAADTEAKATAAMKSTYKGKSVESIVKATLDRGRMSTGLLSAAETLSGFMGSSAGETAGIQSVGDLLSNVFMLNENKAKFMIGTAQTIGGIGNLALTSTAPDANNPDRRLNAADQLTAALAGRINTTDPKASYNPYTSLSDSGFAKSGNLMGELSRSGLVSTGGVDIFGALTPEDVKQMEKAMLLQMEGMSEVAKVGRRMGVAVKDVIQNLQGVYGGRLNEELSRAADTAIRGFNAATTPGSTVGDDLVRVEEARIGKSLGAEERATFLQVEAQRRGGVTLMQQLEEAVEVGRLAGVDTKGVMAVATTATQMLSNLGMTGSGSLALTEDALARVALSRNTGGTPITTAQSLALSGGIMQKARENDDVIAFSVMKQGIASGILDENDSAVQAQIDAFKNNKTVEIGAVRSLFAAKGVNMDPYLTATNIAKAVSESTTEILPRYATDKNLSVGGALERALEGQIENATERTQAISDVEAALGIKGQGMLGIQHAIDVQGITAVRAAVKNAGMSDDSINPFIAVQTTMAGLVNDDPALQGGLLEVRTAEELQKQQTGLTNVQIAAQANVNVKRKLQDQFKSATTGNAGDAFTAGLAQATTAAVEAEAKSLAATNPTKYQDPGTGKPNQAAKDAAKASVDAKGLSLTELVGALGGISYAEVKQFAADELLRVDAKIKDIGPPDTQEKRKQLAILKGEKAQLQTTEGLSLKAAEDKAELQKLESRVATEAAKPADTNPAATKEAEAKGAATKEADTNPAATKEAEAAVKAAAPTPVTVTVNMDKGFQTAIEAQSVTLEQMKDTLCGIQGNLANFFG